MIISQNKLPGLTLCAWAILEPSTLAFIRKSDNVLSVASGGIGQIDVTFAAGTFPDINYVLAAPGAEGTGFPGMLTATLTTCRITNWFGASASSWVAGKRQALYFYAT